MARRKISQNSINRALALYRAGDTLATISRATGMHPQTITRYALAANLPPAQQRRPLKREQQRQAVLAALRDGESTREAAAHTGTPIRTVTDWRTNAGLAKPRRPTTPTMRRRMETVTKLLNAGHSLQAIADYLGVTRWNLTRQMALHAPHLLTTNQHTTDNETRP